MSPWYAGGMRGVRERVRREVPERLYQAWRAWAERVESQGVSEGRCREVWERKRVQVSERGRSGVGGVAG